MELEDYSYKNTLQEHFQRFVRTGTSAGLPKYFHRPTEYGWLSTVCLPGGSKYSAPGRNKKVADQAAARLALNALNLFESVVETDFDEDFNPRLAQDERTTCALVLIDLENSPGYDSKQWKDMRLPCCAVEAFAGKLSSHAGKNLSTLYPFVTKFHIVDSGHKDAADHAMSVRAGRWLHTLEQSADAGASCIYRDALHIVSRDRFASALIDVLAQQLRGIERSGGKVPALVHSITIDECFKKL